MRILIFVLCLLKGIQTTQNINYFQYGVKVIPHPEKMAKGGEDAFYANKQILAVADGVGGWNSKGIDPGLYSKELCANIEKYWFEDKKYLHYPKQLIIDSSVASKNKGSSTLVIITVDEQQAKIYSSYIGDSGYMIFRLKKKLDYEIKLLYESKEQQHSFNYPFQIGNPGDDAKESLKFSHVIRDGDILVVGSDGLFDNIDAKMIKKFLEKEYRNAEGEINHQEVAGRLGQYAFNYSLDKKYYSPFARRAKEQNRNYRGGKSDDITVIVATIRIINNAKEDI